MLYQGRPRSQYCSRLSMLEVWGAVEADDENKRRTEDLVIIFLLLMEGVELMEVNGDSIGA